PYHVGIVGGCGDGAYSGWRVCPGGKRCPVIDALVKGTITSVISIPVGYVYRVAERSVGLKGEDVASGDVSRIGICPVGAAVVGQVYAAVAAHPQARRRAPSRPMRGRAERQGVLVPVDRVCEAVEGNRLAVVVRWAGPEVDASIGGHKQLLETYIHPV